MRHVFQKASEKVSTILLFDSFLEKSICNLTTTWHVLGCWYGDYPDCLSSVSLNIWKVYQHTHMIANWLNKLGGALTHTLKMDCSFLQPDWNTSVFESYQVVYVLHPRGVFQSFLWVGFFGTFALQKTTKPAFATMAGTQVSILLELLFPLQAARLRCLGNSWSSSREGSGSDFSGSSRPPWGRSW